MKVMRTYETETSTYEVGDVIAFELEGGEKVEAMAMRQEADGMLFLFVDCLKDEECMNEDARYVLPNACETALYLSCNLRELIHMSNERLCRRAQWEIRELVQQMVNLVPEALHFMLVPKCQSGRIICHEKCGGVQNG